MGIDRHRAKADGVLEPIAKRFKSFNPNHMTIASLIFAVAAGFFFAIGEIWGLLAAFLMVLLNSLFDALDGKVARMFNKITRRGDFLDHLVDRYSDMAILIGIAVSPWCRDWIGILAIAGVFMTSYTGTQAQAMGLGRNYGGLLGRADRLVMLMLFPLMQIFVSEAVGDVLSIPGTSFNLGIIEVMMVWFALAGNITAVQRALRAWSDIGQEEKKSKDEEKIAGNEDDQRQEDSL